MPPDTSRLGLALLALLSQRPASGYDIRRIFTDTPMGTFSNSPGAIYPALRRLEAAGLVRGRVESGSGLRRRQVFRLTPAGTSALKRWIAGPVTREDVVSGGDELMLRFAFMDETIGPAASVKFLGALQRELAAYLPALREHLSAHRGEMSLSGALALESGIRSYESLSDWCTHAIRAYTAAG